MTTIPVEREKIERWLTGLQCGVISQRHVFDELRALLAEQPQAGAGQSLVESALSAENQRIVPVKPLLADQHPLAARHDQGDEVRRLREALKQAEKNERHRNNAETRYWCDQYKQLAKAALTHSQQGAEE